MTYKFYWSHFAPLFLDYQIMKLDMIINDVNKVYKENIMVIIHQINHKKICKIKRDKI